VTGDLIIQHFVCVRRANCSRDFLSVCGEIKTVSLEIVRGSEIIEVDNGRVRRNRRYNKPETELGLKKEKNPPLKILD
jgi:hypothetical protein